MLITKFNKMIRNKFIWAFVAFIVSISFVLSYSAVTEGCQRRSPGAVGVLGGEDISYAEFRTALLYETGLQNRRRLTDEEQEQLDDSAWKRMAMLRKAQNLGITTPLQEVGEAIRSEPSFTVNGSFSKAAYSSIIAQQLNMTTDMFESFQQETMTIDKMRSVARALTWVAPYEVNTRIKDLTDRFRMEYSLLDKNTFISDFSLSDDDLLAFYNANTNLFVEPDRVSVRYVAFDIDNYFATNAVTEQRVSNYYENNRDDFLNPASTNALDTHLPLAEVSTNIVALIAREDAVKRAKDDAINFMISLIPEYDGLEAPSLDDRVASTNGLEIKTTGFFAEYDSLPELNVNFRFNQAAFRLAPDDPTAMYSDAIVGDRAVYILTLNEKRPAYVPPFEEIQEKVRPVAVAEARGEALTKEAENLASVLRTETNRTFQAVLRGYGLSSVTTEYFSVFASIQTNTVSYANELGQKAAELGTGEVSDPIPVPEGILLARLVDRQAGTGTATPGLEAQLQNTLGQYRSSVVFEDWREALLEEAEFTDLRSDDADAL